MPHRSMHSVVGGGGEGEQLCQRILEEECEEREEGGGREGEMKGVGGR